jgi:prophage regulatory protein
MSECQLSRLVSKSELCERLFISPRTVENLVRAGDFPPPVRIGKQVFWSEKSITSWQQALFAAQDAWVANGFT